VPEATPSFQAIALTAMMALLQRCRQKAYGYHVSRQRVGPDGDDLAESLCAAIGVIAVCYLIELLVAPPDLRAFAYHAVVPQVRGNDGVMLAVGISARP
jgi:Mn2+/Fe2+ NRAMP family transporter